MCVGELRELVVPSQYGYGEFPVGDKIPPRALLVFYVELLKISDPGEDSGTTNMFKEIDVNGDGLISHSEVGWCELGTEIFLRKLFRSPLKIVASSRFFFRENFGFPRLCALAPRPLLDLLGGCFPIDHLGV